MKRIAPEGPEIDPIACPWLVARFIDEAPESTGLSLDFADDLEMLRHGTAICDASCARCAAHP